jgi:NodT family efflux transporter outer membrane factor (OMF) lipoprotein
MRGQFAPQILTLAPNGIAPSRISRGLSWAKNPLANRRELARPDVGEEDERKPAPKGRGPRPPPVCRRREGRQVLAVDKKATGGRKRSIAGGARWRPRPASVIARRRDRSRGVSGLLRASVLVSTACLCGCAAGPNYTPFSIPAPHAFVASGGELSAKSGRWADADLGQWWRSFRDPELNSLVERAVAANLDVEIALDRLQEARTRVLQWVAASLPSGDLSASKSVGTGSDNTRSRIDQTLHAAADTAGYERINQVGGFAAGWDLDIFGKYRREIEATLYDAEAAADDREGVLITVVSDVARAYLDLRAFQARLAVARQSVDAARRNLSLVQTRAKEGITNDLDVALAQRELSTFEAAILPLEGDIDTTKYLIAVLLGRYPEDMTAELSSARPIPTFPARIAVGTPPELLQRRPDVQEAERLLAAATARIGVATADLYPDLLVSGALGAQGGEVTPGAKPITFIGAAGPSLLWPVLDFGTLDARVDIADLQTKEQLARYKRTVLQAVEQVDEAAASFRAQAGQLRDLDRAVAAARQALKLASERYERGLTDFLNVIDAERQLYALQAQYIEAQQSAAEQLVQLYKALGGGWQTYQSVPPIRRPQPAIAAAVNRALAPKNIHEYLKTQQPADPK